MVTAVAWVQALALELLHAASAAKKKRGGGGEEKRKEDQEKKVKKVEKRTKDLKGSRSSCCDAVG